MAETYSIDYSELTEYFEALDEETGKRALSTGLRAGGIAIKSKVIQQLSGITLNRQTGQLVRSVFVDRPVDRGRFFELIFGSEGVPYAAIHEFGGTIRAKNAEYLRFMVDGQWVTTKEVTIPKREPFRKGYDSAEDEVVGQIGLHVIREYRDA